MNDLRTMDGHALTRALYEAGLAPTSAYVIHGGPFAGQVALTDASRGLRLWRPWDDPRDWHGLTMWMWAKGWHVHVIHWADTKIGEVWAHHPKILLPWTIDEEFIIPDGEGLAWCRLALRCAEALHQSQDQAP